MTGMRVLMTTDTIGGVWTYARELAVELAGRGTEVLLAALGENPRPDERRDLERAGVELVSRPLRLEWMADPWDDLERTRDWLADLERAWQPDVVHLNSYGTGDLDFEAPTLVVGHSCVSSWWRAVESAPLPKHWERYREVVGACLRGADLVVAPTRWMLDELQRDYGPLPARVRIPNGRRRPWLAARRKRPLVLSVGRMWDAAKNLEALDRAAATTRWPIAVAGPVRSPDGIECRPAHAVALGALPAAGIWRWMQRASIYALPARYEPFGLSALEAASCGCALVLGDIGPLREIWSDAALFVSPTDATALREAIDRLAEDDALRSELADRASACARDLTRGAMGGAYLDAYRDLCGASDRHGGRRAARA